MKKLDADYFAIKLTSLTDCFHPGNKVGILHQIARDGAEAQKVADITILKKMPEHQLAILEKMINRNAAIFAIESATVDVLGD